MTASNFRSNHIAANYTESRSLSGYVAVGVRYVKRLPTIPRSAVDFRYSNRVRLGVDDAQRTATALRGIVGKRLTYRTPTAT